MRILLSLSSHWRVTSLHLSSLTAVERINAMFFTWPFSKGILILWLAIPVSPREQETPFVLSLTLNGFSKLPRKPSKRFNWVSVS